MLLGASIIPVILINCVFALSQAVTLRAGSFSFATAGVAAIGGYTAASLVVVEHWSALLAASAGIAASIVISYLLALTLRRLRGVFAAIATIAFVEVVQTAVTNWDSVTGGAQGLSGIPELLGTFGLGMVLLALVLLLALLDYFQVGAVFDSVRQDEGAAASQGISVPNVHMWAMLLSGSIGGLAGICMAYNSSAIFPGTFGFSLITEIVAFVFLGGYRSWRGPVVGATIVTLLPEIFRPLSQQTDIFYGAVLVFVVILMPNGVVDTIEPHLLASIQPLLERRPILRARG